MIDRKILIVGTHYVVQGGLGDVLSFNMRLVGVRVFGTQ